MGFRFDDTIFDPAVAEFISKFYEYADSKSTMALWGQCFAEDAIMIKGEGNIVGRDCE